MTGFLIAVSLVTFQILLLTEYDSGGVLNFELGTDVRPEVSTTTL